MRNLSHLNNFLYNEFPDSASIRSQSEPGKEYFIPINDSNVIHVYATTCLGWDHVSLTVLKEGTFDKYRLPSSHEIEEIKKLFFGSEEVMEIHPKKEDYVNIHPYVLHLWRPNKTYLPIPPFIDFFEEVETIRVGKDRKLLIKRGEKDGWISYMVRVLQYGLPIDSKPSWDEMCIAKNTIVGEDEVALQYHARGLNEEKNTICLWLPPKDAEIPLPEPFLVSTRDMKDRIDLLKKIKFSPISIDYKK